MKGWKFLLGVGIFTLTESCFDFPKQELERYSQENLKYYKCLNKLLIKDLHLYSNDLKYSAHLMNNRDIFLENHSEEYGNHIYVREYTDYFSNGLNEEREFAERANRCIGKNCELSIAKNYTICVKKIIEDNKILLKIRHLNLENDE